MKRTDELRCKPNHTEGPVWTGKRREQRFSSGLSLPWWRGEVTATTGQVGGPQKHWMLVVLPESHHYLAAPILQCSISIGLCSLLCYGECSGCLFYFDKESHCEQFSVCLTLPHSSSPSWWDRSEDELQQLESQTVNRCWVEVHSPQGCARAEVETEAGDQAFSCLLLQWNCNNSVTIEQDNSGQLLAKSWGPAVGAWRQLRSQH